MQAPNAARILGRYGLLPQVMEHANMLEANSLRRFANNEQLGTAPLMPKIGEQYHAPLSVIHRGDLQRILLQGAKDAGCDIRTNHKVVKADPNFEARVQLKNGEWIEGDVIIGADGIKSDLRRQMAAAHGVQDRSQPTGDSAYRILIPREKLDHDPEALKLLDANVGMRWMGPNGHIMAYPIKKNQLYNMVLLHPSQPGTDSEQESWTRKGDKHEMINFYKDWCQIVQDLLSYVPPGDVMEWALNSHRPLPSWIENKVALMGDASHPMLPYVAQGSAQAIEDSAVLATCFSLTSDVPLALAIYQDVRKVRAETVQGSAGTTRKALHLPDGPEQQERDRKIKESNQSGHNPDLWADKEFQDFMWGTDVMKDTMENWEHYKSKAQGHHIDDLKATLYT